MPVAGRPSNKKQQYDVRSNNLPQRGKRQQSQSVAIAKLLGSTPYEHVMGNLPDMI